MQIKLRISDEDRFEHVRRGVPRLHCYHSVQTCPMLKAGVGVCLCVVVAHVYVHVHTYTIFSKYVSLQIRDLPV